MSSIAHRGFVHLGMDVSKNSIAVAVLPPDRDAPKSTRSSTTAIRSVAWSSGSGPRRGSGPATKRARPVMASNVSSLSWESVRRGGTVPHPEGLG